ncbi:fructose-bisphosphate aldolase [Candidatus Pelagibacter sp.]|nr:fructose-bisphosphate aldolase [Candidatus Pelagibacter sp.]
MSELNKIALKILSDGKGILAADESNGTMTKRLESVNVPSSPENRLLFRETLFSSSGMKDFIGGVILYDETINQTSSSKQTIPELISQSGTVSGIKVDTGAKILAGSNEEKITEGLDGLRERLKKYYKLGARFTKWRGVYNISDKYPSKLSIHSNAHALASLPLLYYIFILDVNFLAAGKTPSLNNESMNFSFNLSDKLMIISSIIFFHLSPILIMDNFFNQFKNFLNKRFIVIVPLVICLIYFFNYQLSYTGGGVFFILSNLLFDNNYFFYIGSFFFIGFVLYIASLSLNNFFLLILLIISNIQNTIYHKYYEPLIFIMFFTLIKYPGVENFLKKKNNILYLYLFSVIYILMRVFKINYLV